MLHCWSCGRETGVAGRPARSDDCPACRVDLRCCRGCRFHAASLANECSEARAEPPFEKEKANFCDFFVAGEFGGAAGGTDRTGDAPSSSSARVALDNLFK